MHSNFSTEANTQFVNRKPHSFLLIFLVLLIALAPAWSARPASAAPTVYQYANGVTLAVGDPLPVYRLATIPVNPDVTTNLSRLFDGIFDPSNFGIQEDSYINYPRFSGLNEVENTILEQFSATGGFYAYEPDQAFGDGSVVPNALFDSEQGQMLACQFLVSHFNELRPRTDHVSIPGLEVLCDHNFGTDPLYRVSIETRTDQANMPGTKTTDTPMRMWVNVPLLVNTGFFIQTPTVPFGGPGGHISMIFNTTNPNSPQDSIDSKIIGLQAVAMPAFGRDLEYNRLVPSVDPAAARDQVIQRIQEGFPGGTNIQVPDPALVYYMTDAAVPQKLFEPDLVFSGASVDVDGQTIVLKDIVLPALEAGPGGIGPTVTILSPVDGSTYFPARAVNLEGSITDGLPPYTYTWQLEDGSFLGGGTLESAGNTPSLPVNLPTIASKSSPGSLAVQLIVTDGEGATRQQSVTLNAPSSVYLPVTMQNASGTTAFTSGIKPLAAAPDAVNYRFGVEYGSDYPPYGPGGSDLGGVPPDANGFSSGLASLGYPRVFNWYNSLAWERDWRDCSLGGNDCTYGVDRADFVYYAGHGSNGGISLPSNNHDSSWFDGSNARYQNARWIGFSSCLTLRAQWPTPGQEPIRRWFNAFQGAHMLLGFNSLMADIAFGPRLVDNMRIPTFIFIEFPWAQRTIAQAWVQTAFEMNAGKPAYIYATSASVDPLGNKLPKVGDPLLPRPYPVNWYYWVWWNE